MQRSYTFRKHQEYVHIKRKRRVLKHVYKMSDEDIVNCWGAPHKLSKGKIHCSCQFCSFKTKDLGWKHADRVKLAKGYSESYHY